MALAFVLVADGRLETFFFLGAPGLAGAFDAVAFHGGQHTGGLLAAHHRDAGVGPHPQETAAVGAAAHGVVAGAETAADDHGELRHVRTRHGRDHLGPVLGDAGVFILLADHEAGDVLQEHQRDVALVAQFDEVRALERAFGEQDAVVGDDADRVAVDVREAADKRLAVARLELLELAAVHDARNDFADVEGPAGVLGNDAVELLGREQRLARRLHGHRQLLAAVQMAHDVAGDLQRVAVVFSEVVGDARDGRVHVGAAQRFGVHHFAGGGFHQRRAAQEDGALFPDDDRFVAHRRHVGAAGGAAAHHHGDLRDVLRAQPGLVVEDAAEVFLVREHLVLQRQEGAAGIDQVDAGQVVFQRHFLGPQVFFHRHREVGAALHGGVVGHDDHFDAVHAADAGDHARGGRGVVVHAAGGQGREFKEGRAGVEQGGDTFAGQQLAAFGVLLAGLLAAAFGHLGQPGFEVLDSGAQLRVVFLELGVAGIDVAAEDAHALQSLGNPRSLSAPAKKNRRHGAGGFQGDAAGITPRRRRPLLRW